MKQLTLLFALLTFACSKPLDPNVQKLGSSEVTAQLTEIPGPFPSNDLYNYVYVFKYKVFRAGDIHRMALEAPLDQQWMGGIIDKYFSQKGTRYWAIWTVKAS